MPREISRCSVANHRTHEVLQTNSGGGMAAARVPR
jgi:hypothetical protein